MAQAAVAAPAGQQPLGRRQVFLIIGALLLGMLLAALDQTIVATALPTIAGDLHGLAHLSWVVTAYLLASTVSTPLWGKLGDQYGRKVFFQAAIIIFLIGSVLAGISQSMPELIAFRAVQGIGDGGQRGGHDRLVERGQQHAEQQCADNQEDLAPAQRVRPGRSGDCCLRHGGLRVGTRYG